MKKWDAEFKLGRDSLEDDPRQRKPVTVTTQETIAKIHDIIMADRRVTEYYVATELGIFQDVSARCVPNLLGPDLKRTRLNISREKSCHF